MSKKESQAMYGIAILLMLAHHIWGSHAMIQFSYLSVVRPDVVHDIGWFCKICVAMYAFLSGYGLSASYSTEKERTPKAYSSFVMDRAFSFMKFVWCTELVVIPVGLLTGYFQRISIWTIIKCIFGFAGDLGQAHWYISEYLLMLLLFPLLNEAGEAIRKISTRYRILTLAAAAVVFAIGYLLTPFSLLNTARIMCLIVFFEGLLCQKLGVFELLVRKPDWIYGAIIFMACLGIRCFVSNASTYCAIDSLLIVPFMTGLLMMLRKSNELYKDILVWYGKYSKYIWLTHCMVLTVMNPFLKRFPEASKILVFGIAGATLFGMATRLAEIGIRTGTKLLCEKVKTAFRCKGNN